MNDRNSLITPTNSKRLRAAILMLLPVLAALIFWRYQPWMFPVLYGDDLAYLLAFREHTCATNPSEILTAVCLERFRPVAAGSVVMMMGLFGTKMVLYQLVNAVIQAVTGALVFAIAHRLSRGNVFVSLSIALTVAISRLAAYQVSQVIGPVESLTLVFSLGTVYSAIRADAVPGAAWRWGWLALLMAFLAIHTHERFAVVSAWLFGVFLVSPVVRRLPLRRWIALLSGCIAIPVFYVSYKTLALNTPFMIGTGGTYIEIDIPRIVEHARLGITSIFGFNQGPDYLVGLAVASGWNKSFLLALVFAGSWLALLGYGLRRQAAAEKTSLWLVIERLRWPIFLIVLAGFLLFPTLLTIHLEQRWLFAPFTAVMLVAAWAAGRFDQQLKATILVGIMALASISLDSLIMRHYDRLFFVSSPRFAEKIKRDIVDKSPGATQSIVLIAPSSHCVWTLADGGFFKVYGGVRRPVYCLESVESSLDAALPRDHQIYRENAQGQLQDATAETQHMIDSRKNVTFNFVKQYSQGRVDNPGHLNIPNQEGARVMPWDSTSGSRLALTVISGFIYRYDNVPVPANAKLLFDVGMIHPSAFPARAVVRIVSEGGATTNALFTRELMPPRADSKPAFEPISIPLSPYANQRVSIEFATQTPGNDSSGHWIGYVDPRIMAEPSM